MRALQTGNQAPLNLYHVEPAGSFAKKVERAAHELLRGKRSAAGNKWFDEDVENATMAVKSATQNIGILLSDNTQTFRDLQTKQTLEWLRQKEEFEEGSDYSEDFSVRHPDLFRLMAVNYRAPSRTRSTFNDYLLSLEEGAWLRWAFERMNEHLPSGRSLARYLEADDFLESLNAPPSLRIAPRSGHIAPRWIEWALGGRDLRSSEVTVLSEIWNKYVPAYNHVFEGPENDMHGEDDHVDDVYVFALKGDAERGDKNMIVFSHQFFRAVLIPRRRVDLVGYEKSIFGRLRPLG